jgi:hypothetical protein
MHSKTNNDVSPASRIKGDVGKPPLGHRPICGVCGRSRSAPFWIAATFLAATWAAGSCGSPEMPHAQARALTAAQQTTSPHEFDLGGSDGAIDVERLQAIRPTDKPARLAQAMLGDSDESQRALEREHQRAELLARELTITRQEMLLTLRGGCADMTQFKHILESEHAELQKSLEERDRLKRAAENGAAELCKVLPGNRTERSKQDAGEGDAPELRNSLQQERDRSGRLEQELAATQQDAKSQAVQASKANDEVTRLKQASESGIANLKQSLQKEHDRAETLAQDLSMVHTTMYAYEAQTRMACDQTVSLKQAAESDAAELRKSLQQQQERAARLDQDLAAARRDVEAQTALAAKANVEASQSKQAEESGSAELKQSLQREHDRAETLAQQLSSARTAMYAYEAQARQLSDQATNLKQVEFGKVELQKSLKQEQEERQQLEQELAATRRDVATQTELAAKANDEVTQLKQAAESGSTELKQSLQREHDRAETLAQELSTARTSINAYEAQARKASNQSADLKQAAESDAAALRKSLQQERDRAARLERELASERNKNDVPAVSAVATVSQAPQQKAAEPKVITPVATSDATAVQTRATQTNPDAAGELARLVARASILLGQGDIGSARIALERAAETGNAQASFALAETYDPLILRKWGAYGTRGDATRARDLYAKAQAGGIKEAQARLDALRK